MPRSAKNSTGVAIHDLDGDGRADLLQIVAEDPRPLRIRLQEAEGALGPELALKMAPFAPSPSAT